MKTFFSLLYAAIAIILLGCAKNPSGPQESFKDPRQYQWTVDTLAYPGSFQTSMRDIWGSSPKDLYVVGHNDQPGPETMFRFDGKTWKTTRFHAAEGGLVQGPVSLSAIYGFSANDIWAVGEHIYVNPNRPPNFLDSSLVIHYNGSKWSEVKMRFKKISSVWGMSPNDLWVGGDEGVVLHYNGLTWSTQILSPPAQVLYIGGDANRLFAGGGFFTGDLDTLVVFTNNGTGWQLLDKQYLGDYYFSPRFGSSDFFSPATGVYYSVGWGIFRWQGTQWEIVQRTGIFMNDIYGTGPNNIFATGQFGKAYHWNGSDWTLLNLPFDKIPSDIWLTGVWTDGKETFICGFGNGRGGVQVTFILHGK